MATKRQQAQQARGQNIAPKTQTAIKTFAGMKSDAIAQALESYKMQIGYLLPKAIPPMQFFHTCINVLADPRNEKLRNCTQRSVVGGILTGSMLGLSFAKQLGQAHLVPFRNNTINADEAEFIIGYQGHLELMMRTGRISALDVQIIYEKDYWDIQLGTAMKIDHRPAIDNGRILENRGKPVLLYWIVTGKDGFKRFDWMPIEKVFREHRDRSKAYQYAVRTSQKDTPWIESEEEMIKKTGVIMARKLIGGTIEDQLKTAVDNSIIRLQDFQPRPGLEPGTIQTLNLNTVYNVESDETPPAEQPGEQNQPGAEGNGKQSPPAAPAQPELFEMEVADMANQIRSLANAKADRINANPELKKRLNEWLRKEAAAASPDELDEKETREWLVLLRNL